MKVRESDLYEPIKTYLENQGYIVNSEVKQCDITARKGDELIIVELKTRFSTALLIQLARRKEVADAVYGAIPVLPGANNPPNLGGIKLLLRRLETGLILVRFMKNKTRVEVALHPAPFTGRRMHKRKNAIIREIDGRFAEFNMAGQTSKREFISAYKQAAILIAHFLREKTTASPKELALLGTGPKTQQILSGNLYGWYDRVERGVYRLNEAGEKALERYEEHLGAILEGLGDRN